MLLMPSTVLNRYRLCFIGGDGQDEIEFVFFDRVGKEILGKPLLSILRTGHSSSTPLEDIVNSTKGDASIPRELAAIVSTKYKFVVQVTSKSFESESTRPSYQVHRIDTNFGKQPHSSSLRHKPALGVASSSQSPIKQSLLMIGSPGAPRSPSGAFSALEDSYDTTVSHIFPFYNNMLCMYVFLCSGSTYLTFSFNHCTSLAIFQRLIKLLLLSISFQVLGIYIVF
jgi:hypothetical protein